MKYYEMQHCGGLEEALKTKKPISETEFNQRLKNYRYYCFDERIGCHRYILKNLYIEWKKATIWLLAEPDKNTNPEDHSNHRPADRSEDENEAEK